MTAGRTSRRVLVVSYAEVAIDPRVMNQIRWLAAEGTIVDSLGRGAAPSGLSGRHYEITRHALPVRMFAYLFLPNRARFWFLVGSRIPAALMADDAGRYDAIIVNTLDLLPWFVSAADPLVSSDPPGVATLDLHEYSPSQGVGFLWKLLFRRYQEWLITFIASPVFTSRITVAPGIAELYAATFGFPSPGIVRNIPEYVDQSPSAVDGSRIRLVHHGKADSGRGLVLMIDAMRTIDERFTLTLMLVGSPETIRSLKQSAEPLGARVEFRDPVAVEEVAHALNEYDLEVIFFPPVTENLRHALPNKFFEAVQGRLGVVIGDSPEMRRLVEEFGNGVVVRGWEAADLATAISSLDLHQVVAMKEGSDRAATNLSAQAEGAKFLAAVGLDR